MESLFDLYNSKRSGVSSRLAGDQVGNPAKPSFPLKDFHLWRPFMFNRISSPAKFVTALALLLAVQPALAQTGNQAKQTPPVKLGTSGGNVHDASKSFCCSGTLGSLVTKGGVQYILSNNHVLADADAATVGDAISQPGLVGCNASLAQTVATFSEAIPLGNANVDAALAQVVVDQV